MSEPVTMSGHLEAAFLRGLMGDESQTKYIARIEAEAQTIAFDALEAELVREADGSYVLGVATVLDLIQKLRP